MSFRFVQNLSTFLSKKLIVLPKNKSLFHRFYCNICTNIDKMKSVVLLDICLSKGRKKKLQ